jgi:hypothetical protein
MTEIMVGDKFRDDKHNDGPMTCVVTAVDIDTRRFEARWTPGAPAYWYSMRKAGQWRKLEGGAA